MNFNNFFELIALSHQYQYKEIGNTRQANEKAKPCCYFVKYQWFIILIVLCWLPLSKQGLSNNFSGYVVSGLSLFVGILFTFTVALYQKFDRIDWESFKEEISKEKNLRGKKLRNYLKKITVLSLYTILLSVLSIILLGASLLFEELHTFISFSKLYFCFYRMGAGDFITWVFVLFHRGLSLYFLLDLVLMIVYITSAIFDFFAAEYDKIKL